MQNTISFREVVFEDDVDLLHKWHRQQHVVPFWRLNISRDDYERHLTAFLQDEHQTLYMGALDGIPMSYWEAYWAKDDIIADYYDVEDGDQGIHLLIGPPSYLGKGLALPLLKAMVSFQFQHQNTKKVVAEPDIRNEKMIHVFERCGFERIKPIQLPDKEAMLMFCERDRFVLKGEKE
ncbi:GNAT family N-acetyltransferase [Longirhabdus pacifica]|uniref:GNAT family N-acetyltransferase n=1 Tax=Longirhabdus pacifica TaxID=2305227 RepID=UPI0010091217|nr:GNAT family N-acetyltransferase [Longirhabdus pacifica]